MKRRLLTLIAALLCGATVTHATNIAPNGTAYGWNANTSSTANTNRTALPGLNDNNLTTNIDIQPAGDAIGAWEGAGVVWSTPASITSVDFINGDITSGGDGFLTANCTLQFSTDGSTWTNSGWTCSPAYPNSSAAGGQTYTFTGTAVSGKLGARVVGQVRTTDTSYHWIVKEVQVTGSLGTNYTITASAGTGGTISPSGSVSVAQGANQTFAIAASSGYSISGVTVDGTSVGAVSSYTFSNVQANHTISASFAAVPTYTITASAGTGGTISPSGSVSVAQGANQTFTIAANSGYAISSVTVDSTNVGAVSSYTFSNVQANHTISASFVVNNSVTVNVATGFYNQALAAAQTGTFTASFDASVSLSPSNSLVSLSQGAQTAYSGLATIVRFNPSGDIDARNGGAYAAAATIPYSANTNYHFRMVINVPSHTYSIYVTPAGGSEITVGTNYAFRTEQAGVTQLDTWNADVNATPGGSETISNFTITLPAPDFTFSASPASQTLAAGTNTTYTASVSPLNGFTGTVNLSVSGLPSGANGSFSPTSISGSGSSTLTIATTTSTTPGTYNLTVTGTSGTLSHSSGVSLVVTSPSGWIHPGVGVTKAMLDYSKAQAAAGIEPWKTALNNMINDPTYATLSYTPTPWQTVECGSSSNPNYGCSDERRDSMAAYTQALLWYFTGNQTYAQNAIKIMNAWSSTLTGGHTNSNAPLQSGWTGSVWPRAAEIIRCTNAGWSASDVAAFQNMLTTQYLPYVINGGCQNGNWEAVEALAVVNIAVFNEDKTSYDKGVALWRGRAPAYIYLTTDGPSPLAPPNCSLPSWYGETTFVDGIAQETCRDFGHTEWGIEALVLLAETARCQGQDLYSENYRRFLNGYEFHCTYLNGAAVPSWLCGGAVSLGYVQCFECGYNELVNRLGYTMPQTAQYLATKRPTGVNYFIGWETMTYYGQGNN